MKPNQPKDPNQGEGDRVSARSYEQKLKEFMSEGKVDPAARDAARAVDGPEGPALRAAEEAGKAPARTGVVDALKGVGRAFMTGARAAIEQAKHERAQRRGKRGE